jgi:hypothetical protein
MKATSKLRRFFVVSVVVVGRCCLSQDATYLDKVIVDGGTVEAYDATFGTVHSPKGGGTSSGGSRNSLMLWVREKGVSEFRPRISQITALDIDLPDGQILMGRRGSSMSSSPEGTTWELGSFSIVPRRNKELGVRFSMAGKEYRLRFPNPAYKADVPTWQPQSLPLTWEKDGLSATLHSLDLVWNERTTHKGLRWELRQNWSVTWNGQAAEKWYSVGGSVEDAGGNLSSYGGLLGEPAWKLHCAVYPTYGFPFAKDDTIRAGECEMLNIDSESRSFGVLFAGLFAPGEYEIEGGKVVTQSPPGAEGPVKFFTASVDAQTGRVKISVERTAFIRHVRDQLEPRWKEVWQNESGDAVYLGGQGGEVRGEKPRTTTLWRQELWGARDKPFKYGIARMDEPRRFEFTVQPPKAPADGKHGASGVQP